jgi:hypothetical protein
LSPGGLALPAAAPTPSQFYAPRGVFANDEMLVVADSGNHRVLIWHGVPCSDGAPADVVLGQPDFYSEGERLFKLPTGVIVTDGQLLVADAWHHRILVWRKLPERNDQPPDAVIGQDDLGGVLENRGAAIDARSFFWPFGIAYIEGWFYVTDTGNRRVMAWHGLPEPNQPADVIVGQDGADKGLENRGVGVGPNSFRWPHAVAGDGRMIYVADAGNHRVLGWRTPLTDRPADVLMGQEDYASARELAYHAQGPRKLRFPYSVALNGGMLAVSDTANNRVLFWREPPCAGCFSAADAVLGQDSFDGNGENRWKSVERDSLCWPYGIHLHKGLLCVADSGNNRVTLWRNICV